MGLSSGTKLGPYEVVAPAGAGGMGEVYRAHDSRLNREVAIKVLPAAFSRDPDRLRRFQQEAQAVAALNHPNILAIHDFGEHQGSPYIVMELLDGETLRQWLLSGAMPIRKAIEYATQIGVGLAAAHAKGIVHRDLKPENIFITRDGRVKILDFGLAKVTHPEPVTPDAATLASQTEPGVVMGTVGYMSPEQVRGQVTDHRSDLFSFGAILYEMLSGKRSFHGETSVEIMNAILKEDPELTDIGRTIPPTLDRIVSHCLEKNPAERFQSARDLSFALRAVQDSSISSIVSRKPSRKTVWRWSRIAAEVALVGIAIGLLLTRHSAENRRPLVQTAILPPPGEGFWANITQPAAISPDGKFLALIAMRNGHQQLWLRRLDTADAQPIAGSEDASNPFWSPDSRYIAFFIPGKLKKVNVSGGAVSDICSAGVFGMGGAWSSRGVIVLATFGAALKRVPESGGTPEVIPGAELSSDAIGHMWPTFLPDGKHFLYLDWRYPTQASHDDGVWIGSLDGEKARRLPLSSTNVQYSAGYLLFSRDADLVAQKFDLTKLELTGAPVPVARNIQYDTFFHDGMFSVSTNGILVYGTGGVGVNTELTWFDRDGKTLGVVGQPDQFFTLALSPEGKRVAVDVKPPEAREKIWIYDVDRGTRIPLVGDESGGSLYSPVWSPEGKQIAYRTTVGNTSTLLVHSSDGSGEERNGGVRDDLISIRDWSANRRYFAVDVTKFRGRANWEDSLQVVEANGTGKAVLQIAKAGDGKFSPDGHWLAYSDETDGEVYVTPFPGPGARIAVSSGGAGAARWRGDGRELFYVRDDRTLIAAQVWETAQQFRVLASRPLFRLQLPWNVGFYDVTRDGQRILVNARTDKERMAALTLMTDWTAELYRDSNQAPVN